MSAAPQRYLVALGSNMRHRRHGSPAGVLRAALRALSGGDLRILAASPLFASVPLGPSRRRFANGVVAVESALAPPQVLALLQDIERGFGRRRLGKRWGPRVLDLDLILWSGGPWRSRDLLIPHPQFRRRAFVLCPAARLAPRWRDPRSGLTLAQLAVRLTRRRPDPTAHRRPGP